MAWVCVCVCVNMAVAMGYRSPKSALVVCMPNTRPAMETSSWWACDASAPFGVHIPHTYPELIVSHIPNGVRLMLDACASVQNKLLQNYPRKMVKASSNNVVEARPWNIDRRLIPLRMRIKLTYKSAHRSCYLFLYSLCVCVCLLRANERPAIFVFVCHATDIANPLTHHQPILSFIVISIHK